jgi:hypothetical protein
MKIRFDLYKSGGTYGNSLALFAQLILVEASRPQVGAHIASNWPLAGFPVSTAVSFALLP